MLTRPARPPKQAGMTATPMMAQYLALKEEAGAALLFFRMGDFYELFFEDAAIAAAALDIALTRRGRHAGAEVPMCGVPVHAAPAYLARLVRAGHAVAVAEQVEAPAEARRANRPVERAILRVITPATLTEAELLDPAANRWLAVVAPGEGRAGLAWADVSTGQFHTADLAPTALEAELARIAPAEIVAPEDADHLPATARLEARAFRPSAAAERLRAFFGVATLDGFGALSALEVGAAGALIAYLDRTLREALPRLAPPVPRGEQRLMAIDPASRASLALGREGLLSLIDRTLTAPGARLLAAELGQPLIDAAMVAERHDAVGAFAGTTEVTARFRAALRGWPDVERALGRLAAGKGSPRDLATLRDGVRRGAAARALLDASSLDRSAAPVARALAAITDPGGLAERLAAALVEDPGGAAAEGGFIRPGHDPALDRLRAAAASGRDALTELEARYRTATGVAQLRVRYNNMLGYHIEAPARAEAAMREAGFHHRQTMAGAMRYGSDELAAVAAGIAGAGEAAVGCEAQHFEALRQDALAHADGLSRLAAGIARLDVSAALADLACSLDWTRPEMTEDTAFSIEGGRHPLVEAALGGSGQPFVANNCDLSAARLWLVTGPNMGGKSTFLRQNALIAILAQAGSFVPARRARLGLVDRLFSRVGASDDLASGRSTFMVEMVETAAILRQATQRSLVILDEVGRGTSTYDGLAIAWSVVEWLHDRTGARCLFATHYHELTRLADRLEGAANMHLKAREWRGELVFLHEVAPGPADRSYGLAVARLAGVPDVVIARARAVLERLEAGRPDMRLEGELPLFAAALGPSPAAAAPSADPLRERLRGLDPDDLSPREAHALLVELRGLL